MNLLLDSCALIALANGKLPKASHSTLESSPYAYVSSASVWEIAIKAKIGKLNLKKTAVQWFIETREEYGLTEIPLEFGIACAAADLPLIHGDPFDRALIATALHHSLTIITSDRNIPKYPKIKTLW